VTLNNPQFFDPHQPDRFRGQQQTRGQKKHRGANQRARQLVQEQTEYQEDQSDGRNLNH
jgi:hypothetical protein